MDICFIKCLELSEVGAKHQGQRKWEETGTQEIPPEHEKNFALHVTKCWHRVPRELEESPSLEILRSHLDTILMCPGVTAEPGELKCCLPSSSPWFCDRELPTNLAHGLLPSGRASSAPWRNRAREAPGLLEQGPGCSREQERDQLLCRSGQAAAVNRGQLEQRDSPEELKLHPRFCGSAGLGRGCEHPGWGIGVWAGGSEPLRVNWALQRLWGTWDGELQAPDRSVGKRGAGALRGVLQLLAPFDFGLPRDFPPGFDFPHPDACEQFPLNRGWFRPLLLFVTFKSEVWAGPCSCSRWTNALHRAEQRRCSPSEPPEHPCLVPAPENTNTE